MKKICIQFALFLIVLFFLSCENDNKNYDLSLRSIVIEGIILDINPETLEYSVELPSRSPNYPKIEITANSPDVKVVITEKRPDPGLTTGRPKLYPVEVIIDVVAEDRITKKTYTVNITKAPLIVDITPSGSVDGYDYVDLGLSVPWATLNIGAEKLTDIGDYYAWGETKVHDRDLTLKNYNFMLNRCSPDNNLSSIFDAASTNWSKSWRMPTEKEQEELIFNCDWFWAEDVENTSSIPLNSGYYVVSKESDKAIYIPMGSYIPHEDYMSGPEDYAYYWSSWAGPGDQWKWNITSQSMMILLLDNDLDKGGLPASWSINHRADGLPIRPVRADANVFIPDEDFLLDEDETERQGFSVSGTISERTYVDLALPSRTLWATYNVGATLPTEYGNFYAWGETEPKERYYHDTYKFIESYPEVYYTKYVFYERYGKPDAKKFLDPEDDAAYVNWGQDWRMPTAEQFKELINYCRFERKDVYVGEKKIFGYIGVSKMNGHTIYFPAAGWEFLEMPNTHMSVNYWSSELCDGDYKAIMLIDHNYNLEVKDMDRIQGLSVRGVTKK